MSIIRSEIPLQYAASVEPDRYILENLYPLSSRIFKYRFARFLYLEFIHTFRFFGNSSNFLPLGPSKHKTGFPNRAFLSFQLIVFRIVSLASYFESSYSLNKTLPVNPIAFLPFWDNSLIIKGMSSPRETI